MDALLVVKGVAFLLGTAGLAYLSRASLVVPRSHGFYRFFAWEAILALYSSLLFLAWGILFKAPSWLDGMLAVVASLFLFATARVEEAEDIRFFGEEYRAYMRHSKMFVPFLF